MQFELREAIIQATSVTDTFCPAICEEVHRQGSFIRALLLSRSAVLWDAGFEK